MSSHFELFHYLAGIGVGLICPWVLKTLRPPTVIPPASVPEYLAVFGGGFLAAGLVGVFVTNRHTAEEVAA